MRLFIGPDDIPPENLRVLIESSTKNFRVHGTYSPGWCSMCVATLPARESVLMPCLAYIFGGETIFVPILRPLRLLSVYQRQPLLLLASPLTDLVWLPVVLVLLGRGVPGEESGPHVDPGAVPRPHFRLQGRGAAGG